MLHSIVREDVVAEKVPGDTFAILPFFDDASGCEKFVQRVLLFAPGTSHSRLEAAADEVLFVLDGSATLVLDGAPARVQQGVGAFVSRGTPWHVEADSPLELLSVLVRDPEPVPPGFHAVVDLEEEGRQSATAARQFTLGLTAERGCASVTQFIGFVPPGRAPDHFHRYDEVLMILDGTGVLHIDGSASPLRAGTCVHLPATVVHSLENAGDTELRLLGVFRPSGSPAEAYYPDGTPATYPEEN
ncbi:MAG TPA: cupin domain-containing protein [Gaiellaceae bacterium]|jgi:mannose-6-phosphate isomerase-like protein (cupin superfamily)|nr:cupin domain-containing protein [Gaiellaceae bacterium]